MWRAVTRRRIVVIVASIVVLGGVVVAAVGARRAPARPSAVVVRAADGLADSTTVASTLTGVTATSIGARVSTTTSRSQETSTSVGSAEPPSTTECADSCAPVSPPALPALLIATTTTSCAVANDASVDCWGENTLGQLGNGTNAPGTPVGNTSVRVSGLNDVNAVAAGWTHMCALLSSGGVRCWGQNNFGQLGNSELDGSGDPPNLPGSSVPVEVDAIRDARALAAGEEFSCAIVGTGSVKCWGSNMTGSLGNGYVPDGSVAYSLTPVSVEGIANATSLAANAEHACAVVDGGRVECWGGRDFGLGARTDSGSPVVVPGVTNAISVDVGYSHACAVLVDRHIACWGENDQGQLGDGTTASSQSAVVVAAVNDAVAVAAGYRSSCALLSGGSVECWGGNGFLALGDGNDDSSAISPSPVGVIGVTTARAIGGHGDAMCVLVANGDRRCWGANESGQFGDGNFDNSSTPQLVKGS